MGIYTEISHLPILSALPMGEIHLSLSVFCRIEVILLSNGNSLHHIDTNLNCKVRVLRKFFVNFKMGTRVTNTKWLIYSVNQTVELSHNIQSTNSGARLLGLKTHSSTILVVLDAW